MKGLFESPLGPALHRFLEFKRRRGYRYNRAEFTLRNFDRFLATRAKQDPPWRLDEVILAWLANRPGRLAVSVSQEMAVIRQFWFYVRRLHPARCRRDIRWPKLPTETTFVPHVLSTADFRTLLRLARDLERPRYRGALYRALLLVLYCTGLRFGEALRLRIADVDLHRNVIFVDEFKGRARWVPFHPSLQLELDLYLRARREFSGSDPRRDDPFFLASDGGSLSASAAGYTLCRLFRTAGLKPSTGRVGPRPYDLRHTFAVHRLTRWYRERVDLHARLPWLSAYMGHVNLLGTETYLTATPELLALAAHRFRRRFAGVRRR
jgi:integrase/recombinase XerD